MTCKHTAFLLMFSVCKDKSCNKNKNNKHYCCSAYLKIGLPMTSIIMRSEKMIQLNYIFVHHSISTLYYIYVFNMFSIQIIWKPFDNTVLKNAKNVYLFTSYTFKKLCLDYSNKPPFCGNVSKSNCGQFFLVSDCLASLCIMLYFSRSYSLIFILYDRLIISFIKMAHKS